LGNRTGGVWNVDGRAASGALSIFACGPVADLDTFAAAWTLEMDHG